MPTYTFISLLAGGVMLLGGEIFGKTPFARRWLEALSPLRRHKNILRRGVIVELAFGLILAGFYLLFFRTVPLQPELPRAIFFALICWTPSSVYKAATDGAVFEVPAGLHLYAMFVSLLRLLAASLLTHLTLKPVT